MSESTQNLCRIVSYLIIKGGEFGFTLTDQ